MPTHMRFKLAWQFYDKDPKNQAVINPCFRRQLDITDPTSGTDAQALTDDLATAITGLWPAGGTPFTVSAYNVQAPRGTPPLAVTKRNPTATPVVPSCVPEAAIVLSFFSGQNVKSKRGRLYVPAWVLSPGSAEMSLEVSATQRTSVGGLVSRFAALGGTNVDWIVWSELHQTAAKVTDYFISSAWGTVRSRGVKASTRTVGTTSG
jgi:hypothetical protein